MPTLDLHSEAASLTTHALDIAKGVPAAGLRLNLYREIDGQSILLTETTTNIQGRCEAPLLTRSNTPPGPYRLEFDAKSYHGVESPFGFVTIAFNISDISAHHHVPLLLSPGGYSSYRGSPPARVPQDRGKWGQIEVSANAPHGPAAPSPGIGGAGLTIHVIDIARGIGAGGLEGKLVRLLPKEEWNSVGGFVVNDEGRTDNWLIAAGELRRGDYELQFEVGKYYSAIGFGVGDIPFFDRVRIRLRINDQTHHHIPLLLSPWGYSCYRGS
jgi:5-hydroxyisourate hydrolase